MLEQNNNLASVIRSDNFIQSLVANTVAKNDSPRSSTSSIESSGEAYIDHDVALSTSCSDDSFELSDVISPIATNFDELISTNQSQIVSPVDRELGNGDFLSFTLKKVSFPADDCMSSSSNGSVANMSKSTRPLLSFPSVHEDICNKADKQHHSSSLMPSTSYSVNSFLNTSSSFHRELIRKSIDQELGALDTCLPRLDFSELEEKLTIAAMEQQTMERKLLGEQVRRRLALQVDQYTTGPSPRVFTRPSKSNLGFRLQTAMNLQVCYMNDVGEENDGCVDTMDNEVSVVPKSKSTPNLNVVVPDGSNLNASQLQQRYILRGTTRSMIEEETKLLLLKARETAKMQMELEKLSKSRGIHTNRRKYFRIDLSKMLCKELSEICAELSCRIEEENSQLIELLMEKDALHMKQDSLLVDIEDMIQHENNSEIGNLPQFLMISASGNQKLRRRQQM